MFMRSAMLSIVLAAAATLWPAAARAQETWIPSASAFAGVSAIPAFDVDVVDPATASTFDIQGRKIRTTAAWGGAVSLWHRIDGRRLRWGVRGEVLRQKVESNPQVLTAAGTLFGRPYNGPLPLPSAEGSATLLTGAFLLGWQIGGDAGDSFGRLTPYAGIGGGIDRVAGTVGTAETEDTGGLFQAIGGLALGLNHRTAAFVEYRFQRVSQTIVLGSQNNVFAVKPSHVVAGFTIGL